MAVNTVFGRSGDVVAQSGDYAIYYAPNGAHLPAGGLTGQVLTKLSATNFDTAWVANLGSKGSDVVAGTVLLSVAPVDPNNPIAFGQNDPAVERITNKVVTFTAPTDTKYPSALLVKTSLDAKVDKLVALTPATKTKISFNADGLVIAGADATTADIADTTNKRYVTDTHISALGGLSGINSGDQDLSGCATVGALATTNANVSALSASLSSYALASSLTTTNANVTANTASIANCALASDLATTNANVSSLSSTVSTNYTPITTHNTLQTQVDGLTNTISGASGPIAGPATIKATDAGTTTAPTVLYIDHDTTGGATLAGFGSTLEFRGRSSSTAARTQGKIRTEWTNPADVNRSANIVFSKVLNAVASDFVWMRSDGSLAVGNNLGGGFGTVYAQSGYQTSGGSIEGQVLRYSTSASAFVAGTVQTSDVVGQFSSCQLSRVATLDQTSTAETTHLQLPITVAQTGVGATWRVTTWGNMDNGTTAVLYTARLRWGNGGTIIIATTVQGTTTLLTGKTWRLEFLVTLTSVGGSGTARASVLGHDHTANSLGQITISESNTGATDVTSISTSADTFLNFTWAMDTTTGAPHVRTLGGIMELVKQ